MKRHVLVVDDSQAIRRAIEMSLSRVGFTVTQAENTADGIGVMRSVLHPLVVMLDCTPPPNDSLHLLPGALADPWIGQRHAFILMDSSRNGSPHPDLAAIAQALPQGTQVLEFPFTIQDLIRSVVQAMRRLAGP